MQLVQHSAAKKLATSRCISAVEQSRLFSLFLPVFFILSILAPFSCPFHCTSVHPYLRVSFPSSQERSVKFRTAVASDRKNQSVTVARILNYINSYVSEIIACILCAAVFMRRDKNASVSKSRYSPQARAQNISFARRSG